VTELLTIRASATPGAFDCAESIRSTGMTVSASGEASALGTGCHQLLAQVVPRDVSSTSELPLKATAEAYDLDPDELGRLTYYGIMAWKELRPLFPAAVTEVALSATLPNGVRITGHLDVLASLPEHRLARIADWKSGMLDKSYYHQLAAYAYLVLMDDADVDTVEASIVWLRESQIETYSFTRAQAMEWANRLVTEVLDAPAGSFTTGKHCGFCPRAHDCPALFAMARRDIALFAGMDPETAGLNLATMDAPKVVELFRRTKVVEKLCGSLQSAVRREVEARGSLDAGDGMELRFNDDSKRVIDPLKAWPVLQARLSDTEMAPAITLSIGALEDAVAEKAGRGMKGKMKQELGEALDAAGAITKKVTRKMIEARKK
jgi:uncharacterized protein DUF2800